MKKVLVFFLLLVLMLRLTGQTEKKTGFQLRLMKAMGYDAIALGNHEYDFGPEWLALMEFLSSMKDTNGNGIPDIDKKYSGPVKCFFPVNAK